MTAGRFRLGMGLLLVCLAACAASDSKAHEGAMRTDTRSPAWGDYTYTDAPIEARIGRHVYRIPANYFYDQMGPSFQGDVSLRMQWPDMTPMAPGTSRQQTWSEQMKAVAYDLSYVDRVDIHERMRRAYSNFVASKNTLEYNNPEDRLDLRIPQPESLGLVRYDLDPDLARKHSQDHEVRYGYPHDPVVGFRQDWYLKRDTEGHVTTFIKCDTDEITDGLVVRGRELIPSENPRDLVARCRHLMIFPEESLSVTIHYARVLLPEWRTFEDRITNLLQRTRSGIGPKEDHAHRPSAGTVPTLGAYRAGEAG